MVKRQHIPIRVDWGGGEFVAVFAVDLGRRARALVSLNVPRPFTPSRTTFAVRALPSLLMAAETLEPFFADPDGALTRLADNQRPHGSALGALAEAAMRAEAASDPELLAALFRHELGLQAADTVPGHPIIEDFPGPARPSADEVAMLCGSTKKETG